MVCHGGRVFEASRLLGKPPEEILDFSSNLNDFFPFEVVEEILKRHLGWLRYYPDVDHALFCLSRFLDLPQEKISVGSGSADLLFRAFLTLSPKRVLLPVPSFPEYERAAQAVGAEVLRLPLRKKEGFKIQVEKLLEMASSGVDLLVICNPHNPTGTFLTQGELVYLIEALDKRGIWLLLDEAFVDFVNPDQRPDLSPFFKQDKRLLVLRSLTKTLSIPGLRLGYLIGPEGFVKRLRALTPPWHIGSLGQVLLEHIGEVWKVFEKGLPEFYKERERFKRELSKRFKVYPSEGNFFFLEVGDPLLPTRLYERGILVRGAEGFKGFPEGFIRVAVKLPSKNDILLKTLEEVCDVPKGTSQRDTPT